MDIEIIILFLLIIVLSYILYKSEISLQQVQNYIKGGNLESMIINRSKKPNYLHQMVKLMYKNSKMYGNKISETDDLEYMTENLNKFLDNENFEKIYNNSKDPKKFIKRYLEYKKTPNYKCLIDMDNIKEVKID